MQPSPSVLQRIETITSSPPIDWRVMSKGHTAAATWVMRFQNGSSAFIKHATDEQTTQWLRNERSIYEHVNGHFLPRFIGWDGGKYPILIIEDLSGGRIVPPWTANDIDRVFTVLDALSRTRMPDEYRSLEAYPEPLRGWEDIAGAPLPFLHLGLVTTAWLEAALPILIQAEREAILDGNSLVHSDLRSDNLCFLGDRTLLVDWSWAHRGHPKFDLISWLPSLHAEGGPPPWEVTLEESKLIALQAGFLARRVTRPRPELDSSVQHLQFAQLRSALPWAAKALGLAPISTR